MSTELEQALALMQSGWLDEASRLAATAIKKYPADYHGFYVVGQCFRYMENYMKACEALERAVALEPRQTPVHLALAIARQLNGEYSAAIEAIKPALELDRDYALGYNTLAMTQKLMGAYEKSAHNYEEGLKALARLTAKSLLNAEDSPRVSHRQSRGELWSEYAVFGALYLAADSSMDQIAWPTGEMAERDERTHEFRGWYWQDHQSPEQKRVRLFLPNYFNTFCNRLHDDSRYATLVGNRSTVLRLMGDVGEADRHLQEAEDFTSESPR